MTQSADFDAATTEGLAGAAPALLLCEHASAEIPAEFRELGLPPETRFSHAAWDPGALTLSRHLSAAMGVPLVFGAVSRLLYDCNRPPEAPDSVPEKSEIHEIPGNRGLSPEARADRANRIYHPFCAAVDAAMEAARPAALITVHSFTPVYFGKHRPVEIGVLHDTDTRLADALLAELEGAPYRIERNQPYGPADGVTHSLKRHAIARGLPNVMLEVRNDLLADPARAADVAALLARTLPAALGRMPGTAGAAP
ncbi:N-formylglutamate amidohydrolase [Seohaeicola zhoushanensis]|nr:N-formylglutamate amidohydrolase [Seohaeicola zhoushanensis]